MREVARGASVRNLRAHPRRAKRDRGRLEPVGRGLHLRPHNEAIEVLKELGIRINSMRVGNDNLFQSKVFSETITGLLGCTIEVVATTGASGAAREAGYGAGIYGSIDEAARLESTIASYDTGKIPLLNEGYELWKADLMRLVRT